MNAKTKRCSIRPFQALDIDAFMEFRNDTLWMRYQGYKSKTKEIYEKDLLGETSLAKGAQFAVIDNAESRCIGDIYLRQENDVLWAGCTISPRKARQGYAYEVLGAVLQWAKEKEFTVVGARVMPENKASIALLEKSGFSLCGIEDGEKIYRFALG